MISSNTPQKLIRSAMLNARLLQEGDDPTGEDYANYLVRLNDLVALWQTLGIKLWTTSVQTVPLVAGTNSYVVGPGGAVNITKPLLITEAFYQDPGSNTPRSLIRIAWSDFYALDQTTQGSINSFFVDQQQGQFVLWVWQTPTANQVTGTLKILVRTAISQWQSMDDSFTFPPEWSLALQWALAEEICTGQPLPVQQRCQLKAEIYRNELESWDREWTPISFSMGGANVTRWP